jgi:hypothetical protein
MNRARRSASSIVTQPRRAQTSGMVDDFNGRIE